MKKYLLLTGLIIVFHCSYSQCDPSTQVPRYTLIEGFTSCSSPICLNGHINLQNVLTQNDAQSGKYTLIKYQMNFPNNGDAYYTLEGGVRRDFYNVTCVPCLHVDSYGENELTFTNAKLLNYQSELSCMEVKGSFSVKNKTVNATIHIKPTIDINEGNNLRLFMAIVEKETYKNTCTSGQNRFVQVMKKFMPDAEGIEIGNLTANQTITKKQTWEFKGGYSILSPGQIVNHEIEHTVENFDNLEVVAWLQNIATKEVYNSCTATKETNATFSKKSSWKEITTNLFDSTFFEINTFSIKGDTTINGKNYSKIYANNKYCSAFRETDDNRIYVYWSNGFQPGEYLTYDFDWYPGKKLYFHYPDEMGGIDSAVLVTLGNSIDSIQLLDGKYYQFVKIGNSQFGPELLIKGIGKNTGGFFNHTLGPPIPNGDQYALFCFFIDDILVYSNPFLNCSFVAVTEIIDLPTTVVAGIPLELSGTVLPNNATCQDIVWSIYNAGTTGATITDNILNTANQGTVTVTATVKYGATLGIVYMQNFAIEVESAGINDFSQENANIKVYPNPTTWELMIEN